MEAPTLNSAFERLTWMGQQLAEGATIDEIAAHLGEPSADIERALIRSGILDVDGGTISAGGAAMAPVVRRRVDVAVGGNKDLMTRLLSSEEAMLRIAEITETAERLNGPKEQRHLHSAIVKLAHAQGVIGRREALLDVAAISISLAAECTSGGGRATVDPA